MTFQSTSIVYVYLMKAEAAKLRVGRLLLKDRRIFFEYDADFIKTALELSPFKLPLKNGVMTSNDRVFDGLFGVFNDSLPDGWGRLLLDRKLMKAGLNPEALSPLDRLCFVGSNAMGALIYEPENQHGLLLPHENLDEIAEEIRSFQENDDDRFVEDLLVLGSSSAGARPKVLIHLEEQDWIIKFRSSLDPKDIGNIEYAYHLMAKEAGLDVPAAKLFPSRKGFGYFGAIRFDRISGKRVHVHTVAGLLHADHREPSLDYETIMKATLWLTRDVRECEKQFRAAVFNVLSHNRDDHAKNFSYRMDEKGTWSVSPAYDLTFSTGPAGEHCTMIMGEGKTPTFSHLLKLAAVADIKQSKACEIIDEVAHATSRWKQHAQEAGVGNASQKRIQSTLAKIKPKMAVGSGRAIVKKTI